MGGQNLRFMRQKYSIFEKIRPLNDDANLDRISYNRIVVFFWRDCKARFKRAKPIPHRRHQPSHRWTAGCNSGSRCLIHSASSSSSFTSPNVSASSASISKTLCNCAQMTLKLCAIKAVGFFFVFFSSYRPLPGLILFIRWTIQFPGANKGGRRPTVPPPSLRIHS